VKKSSLGETGYCERSGKRGEPRDNMDQIVFFVLTVGLIIAVLYGAVAVRESIEAGRQFNLRKMFWITALLAIALSLITVLKSIR
jgi:hypothetical protein